MAVRQPDSTGPAQELDDPKVVTQARYANERTFLAWIRTSLVLTSTGLAITELLPQFDVAAGRRVVGLPLIALGTITAAVSYRQWLGNERALRRGRPLPPSRLPVLVAVGVTAVAALALVLSALR
jgi:putative membrane protein